MRGGELDPITNDHTFVQRLVDEGKITAEEAEGHPQRSVIMRVLTGDPDARPTCRSARPGSVTATSSAVTA